MRRVDIDTRLRQQRLAFEAQADDSFEAAWAGAQTLAQPLKFEYDFWRAPSGRWRDFFVAAPYRALDLPLLLLEDLELPAGQRRDEAELALLTASALSAAAVLSSELVLGAECNYGIEHSLLTSGLMLQAQWHLATLGLNADLLRQHAAEHWCQHADAMLTLRQRWVQRSAPYQPEHQSQLGRRWAPVKTAVYCAAALADKPALWPRLDPLFDEAAALFQLGRDLASISRDLARGHCTYPVACLLQALGGSVPAADAPNADRVLFAALLTDTLPKLASAAGERVLSLQQTFASQGLHHVSQAIAALGRPFDDLTQLYANQNQPAQAESPGFALSHHAQRQQVMKAAVLFLRNDPLCQEAWEWYRWGFLGQPELLCRVFTTGVVLEHRIAAGQDCGAEVDALFDQYQTNDFSYFDQPSIQPPDFDTLGLMLRLLPHGRDTARCRAQLQTPLRWLLASIEPDGGIPVFMTAGFEEGPASTYMPMIGRRCAGVQAGVLLGLAELVSLGEARFQTLLARGSNSLFAWFKEAGAGALSYYDIPYGGMLILTLIDKLRRLPGWAAAGDAPAAKGASLVAAAQAKAIALLLARRSRARASALDTAAILLASRFEGCQALSEGPGAELLLRMQRQDGGWEAEPCYCAPSRGNLVNWHASRLITTAVALHALSALAPGSDPRRLAASTPPFEVAYV